MSGIKGSRVIPGAFEATGMPDSGLWETLWANPAKVISDAGVGAGMSVVDLCSGDGWFRSIWRRLHAR